MAGRGLRIVLVLLAVVATSAGTLTVLTGSSTVLSSGTVSPSVDSELRFYAAWYVGVGLVLAWTAFHVEVAGTVLRSVCGVLLLGAVGRSVSLVMVGRPHPVYLVLLAIEVALPVVLLPWQHAVAKHHLRDRRAP